MRKTVLAIQHSLDVNGTLLADGLATSHASPDCITVVVNEALHPTMTLHGTEIGSVVELATYICTSNVSNGRTLVERYWYKLASR